MIETVIFQDGVLFEDIENALAWMKQWASQKKKVFHVRTSDSFKDQMDNSFREGFDMKKMYDFHLLPFLEDETFLKEHNFFHKGRSSRFYGEMSSIIKEIFVEGKKLMRNKAHRVRIGINSFHSYDNISSSLKVGCVLKYIDSIMSQEGLDGKDLEKEYFSLEKTLNKLVFQGLNSDPKKTLYITNHPSSLGVAKNLKYGRRKGSLICVGAPWAGSRGNLECGHKDESGKLLKFDYIPQTPYELKQLIRTLFKK